MAKKTYRWVAVFLYRRFQRTYRSRQVFSSREQALQRFWNCGLYECREDGGKMKKANPWRVYAEEVK